MAALLREMLCRRRGRHIKIEERGGLTQGGWLRVRCVCGIIPVAIAALAESMVRPHAGEGGVSDGDVRHEGIQTQKRVW